MSLMQSTCILSWIQHFENTSKNTIINGEHGGTKIIRVSILFAHNLIQNQALSPISTLFAQHFDLIACGCFIQKGVVARGAREWKMKWKIAEREAGACKRESWKMERRDYSMEKMWGTSVFSKRICGESEREEALEERRSEDSGTKVRLSFFNADDDKSNL